MVRNTTKAPRPARQARRSACGGRQSRNLREVLRPGDRWRSVGYEGIWTSLLGVYGAGVRQTTSAVPVRAIVAFTVDQSQR